MQTFSKLVIGTDEVTKVTGRGERTAQRYLAEIRKLHNKPKGAFVTFSEFCDHKGFKLEEVINIINKPYHIKDNEIKLQPKKWY